MEELKDFSKAPGPYHWALLIFIYLFIYAFVYLLFIYSFFNVNKFLLTVVNNSFFKFKYFKTILAYRSSLPEVFSWGEVFCGCDVDSQGASMHGCDFNKVAKRFC